MAHASNNATWKDYPDTSTLVTATTLENQENAIDRLTTQMFGANNRTVAPCCEVYYNGTTATLAVGNSYASGGWVTSRDTDSMFGNNGTQVYIQVPLSGRYFCWNVTVWLDAGSGAQAAFLTRNNTQWTSATTSFAFDNKLSTQTGTGLTNRIGEDFVLTAGDKIYLMLYTSFQSRITGSAGASFGQAYCRWGIRWVAPL